MEYENNDGLDELISSEQLQVFDVIDEYCDICGDITPHHIDTPKLYNNENHDFEADTIFCEAISTKECVRCRENEEKKLNLLI